MTNLIGKLSKRSNVIHCKLHNSITKVVNSFLSLASYHLPTGIPIAIGKVGATVSVEQAKKIS
ncbi:hypothetical protein H710_00684 [Bartonella bacilliformis Ver097]|uniref:Uncharacterized protein n=1 Tax=Bartonella bacilliformis Ver097 TaxID=1293911 RepID=A0A072RF19_BARBA|nr:hypothetical protein H710_00684 [Bartonella bacilliformis Ver097]